MKFIIKLLGFMLLAGGLFWMTKLFGFDWRIVGSWYITGLGAGLMRDFK